MIKKSKTKTLVAIGLMLTVQSVSASQFGYIHGKEYNFETTEHGWCKKLNILRNQASKVGLFGRLMGHLAMRTVKEPIKSVYALRQSEMLAPARCLFAPIWKKDIAKYVAIINPNIDEDFTKSYKNHVMEEGFNQWEKCVKAKGTKHCKTTFSPYISKFTKEFQEMFKDGANGWKKSEL